MSEDAIDAMPERMAREEQDDLDRRHGQQILDMLQARNTQDVDPLLEALNQAHRRKASESGAEAEADKE
jgi:hypothetical protein